MQYTYDTAIFNIPTNSRMACLCTIIKNKDADPNKAIWILLPNHGTSIAGGGQFVMVGNLSDWLQRKRYRTRNSILRAFDTNEPDYNKFEIVQTPLPHVFHATPGTKTITLDSTGNIVTATPCWKV